ncbi:MAG: glycosyltransferase [Candidatus Rokuibacteriota bacterium]
MTTAEAAFWLAVLALGYTWLGYPLLLAAVAAFSPPPARSRTSRPRLSVIVAAYNEAHCIEAKIAGTLRQRYPADRLEVIVVSDGSTDWTDEIVRGHPDPRVRLIRQEPRAGKSAALNRAVAAASGDVLVFTDANALFAPDALVRLAGLFADSRVGLVSGQGLYAAAGTDADARAVASGYVRYEALVKRGESALGFLASADGAIYALRRAVWRPLHPAEVNDLLHPIEAALGGFACRFDEHAATVEPPSGGAGQEFRRHVRIVAQGIAVTVHQLPRLVAAGCWRAVWALVSHRVLRWSGSAFLLAALGANLALLADAPFYQATLAGQAAWYAAALVGWLAERRGVKLGKLALPYYFCVVSAAGVGGIVRYVRGGADATWAPAGSASVRDQAA